MIFSGQAVALKAIRQLKLKAHDILECGNLSWNARRGMEFPGTLEVA